MALGVIAFFSFLLFSNIFLASSCSDALRIYGTCLVPRNGRESSFFKQICRERTNVMHAMCYSRFNTFSVQTLALLPFFLLLFSFKDGLLISRSCLSDTGTGPGY